MWYGHWHMAGMWIWWLLGVVLIGVVVWAIVRADASKRPAGESPEDIVKRRYASGEIDKEQYEHTLADLRK